MRRLGHDITIIDRFITGHRAALLAECVEADIGDEKTIARVCRERGIEGAIHFAAFCAAGESVTDPAKYFRNNVQGTIGLMNGLSANGVKHVVLSSSSAVYGTQEKMPIDEDAPKNPESPYGESKLMCERLLPWYETAGGPNWVSLRYFNASGASSDASLGDDARPATRALPVALEVVLGKRPEFSLFGDDYPTPDGTCIRDYVHVEDLAHAHVLALDYLARGGASDVLNVGSGRGYSNRELIDAVKRATGVDFRVVIHPRRPGDPVVTQADITKIRRVLGWAPEHDLDAMVRTAWEWRRRNPDGYPE